MVDFCFSWDFRFICYVEVFGGFGLGDFGFFDFWLVCILFIFKFEGSFYFSFVGFSSFKGFGLFFVEEEEGEWVLWEKVVNIFLDLFFGYFLWDLWL